MFTFRFSPHTGPRLLAAFGIAALVTGIGLATSRPTHSAGGPISVSRTPLMTTTTADGPDQRPVREYADITISDGYTGAGKTIYAVPAHKRIVIDKVFAYAFDNTP